MGHTPKAKHPWDTLRLIGLGGLVGLSAAVMQNFYAAFRNAVPEGSPFVDTVIRAGIYTFAGALVLGVISVIRNWLVQDR
jgi:hypothetical protein